MADPAQNVTSDPVIPVAPVPNPVPPMPSVPVADPVAQAADDLAQLTKDPLPTFVEEIKQFESHYPQSKTPDSADFQVMYNQGGKFKEQLEALAGSYRVSEQPRVAEKAVTEFTEIPTNPELEKQELAGYMEKIEKEAELSQPVTDDYNNILLGSSSPQNPVVTLPLTEEQIQTGLHHKVFEAVRWLAIWCVRQTQKLHGKVQYKQ